MDGAQVLILRTHAAMTLKNGKEPAAIDEEKFVGEKGHP